MREQKLCLCFDKEFGTSGVDWAIYKVRKPPNTNDLDNIYLQTCELRTKIGHY